MNKLSNITAPNDIVSDSGALLFGMSCEDYFADPCPKPSLNNSGVKVLLKQSPMHFAAGHPRLKGDLETVRKETQEMCLGSIVHRLALGAGKDYEVLDFPDFKTKEARSHRDAAIEAGKVPILAHAFDNAKAMAPVIRQHLDDVLMGEPFMPEVVCVWQIATKRGPIWCRAMIDAWCPSLKLAVDLKTSTDASNTAVTNKMARELMDTQAAWYSRGIGHVLGIPGQVRFAYLFCEKDAPHATQPFELDEAWLSSAWDLCEEAADLFAKCLKAGQWPGYPRNTQLLSPPDWLIRERMFRGFARDNCEDIAA